MGKISEILMVGLLAGPYFLYTGSQQKSLWEKLDSDGVTVPAVINGGTEKTGRRSSTRFDVIYKMVEGEEIRKNFRVSSTYFNAHVSGEGGAKAITDDKVQVKYLPLAPSEAILIGSSSNNSAGAFARAVGELAAPSQDGGRRIHR
jgi:hypothetical protein